MIRQLRKSHEYPYQQQFPKQAFIQINYEIHTSTYIYYSSIIRYTQRVEFLSLGQLCCGRSDSRAFFSVFSLLRILLAILRYSEYFFASNKISSKIQGFDLNVKNIFASYTFLIENFFNDHSVGNGYFIQKVHLTYNLHLIEPAHLSGNNLGAIRYICSFSLLILN